MNLFSIFSNLFVIELSRSHNFCSSFVWIISFADKRKHISWYFEITVSIWESRQIQQGDKKARFECWWWQLPWPVQNSHQSDRSVKASYIFYYLLECIISFNSFYGDLDIIVELLIRIGSIFLLPPNYQVCSKWLYSNYGDIHVCCIPFWNGHLLLKC